jgi:hypothetical protein
LEAVVVVAVEPDLEAEAEAVPEVLLGKAFCPERDFTLFGIQGKAFLPW